MVKYKYKGKQLIVQELVTTLRQRVQNAKEAYSKDVDNEVMEKRWKTLRAKLMKETKTINSTPFVTSLPIAMTKSLIKQQHRLKIQFIKKQIVILLIIYLVYM